MSDNFTRRSMLGVTGAGLALSGCRRWPFGFGGGDGNIHSKGWSEDHGLPATFDPDDVNGDANKFRGLFNPAYLALVHVKLASEWKMNFTFASYEIGQGVKEEGRLKTAVEILTAKVGGVPFDTLNKDPA